MFLYNSWSPMQVLEKSAFSGTGVKFSFQRSLDFEKTDVATHKTLQIQTKNNYII